ncbi:MAG: pilin [Candidatus Parabeggiatoa sp.]|nr:pilin [Candidatus Parabeggiatoa sp.]
MTRWLSVTLSPDVPVVSTVGASSLKSPASIWRSVVFVVLVVGLMATGRGAWAAEGEPVNITTPEEELGICADKCREAQCEREETQCITGSDSQYDVCLLACNEKNNSGITYDSGTSNNSGSDGNKYLPISAGSPSTSSSTSSTSSDYATKGKLADAASQMSGIKLDLTSGGNFPSGNSSESFDYTLSITKEGDGSGTITSTNFNCNTDSTDCEQGYITGTPVTLTATPDDNSIFLGWGGACKGGELENLPFQDKTTVVAMDANRSCTAHFASKDGTLIEQMITTAIIGILSAVATPNYSCYMSKSKVSEAFGLLAGLKTSVEVWMADSGQWPTDITQLTDTTSGNYVDNVWLEDSAVKAQMKSDAGDWIADGIITYAFDSENHTWQCTSNISEHFLPKVCESSFQEETPLFSLSISNNGDGGSVSSSPTGSSNINVLCNNGDGYSPDTEVTLTAIPDAGFVFKHFFCTDDGSLNSSTNTNPRTIKMDKNRSCNVFFAPAYTLNTSKIGNGSVTSNPVGIDCGADCKQDYATNTPVILTATPANGAIFTNWSGENCSGTNPVTSITMDTVKACTASFVAIPTVPLVVEVTGRGTVGTYCVDDNDSNCVEDSQPQPDPVVINNGGIYCSSNNTSDCVKNYPLNQVVTLSARLPYQLDCFMMNACVKFAGWTGDCVSAGTNSTVEVTMDSAKTCTANFELEVVACDSTWLDNLIAKFENDLDSNPPHSIYKYNYNGEAVYYVPPQCCDQYSTLYDACGKEICAPDGGITGKGDGKCADFFEVRKDEEVIFSQKATGQCTKAFTAQLNLLNLADTQHEYVNNIGKFAESLDKFSGEITLEDEFYTYAQTSVTDDTFQLTATSKNGSDVWTINQNQQLVNTTIGSKCTKITPILGKNQVSGIINGLQTGIEVYYQEFGEWPDGEFFKELITDNRWYVADIAIISDDKYSLQVTIDSKEFIHPNITSKTIRLVFNTNGPLLFCGSGYPNGIDSEFLPENCQHTFDFTVENSIPNNGDGNGDGIPDSEQANVTSIPNAVDGNYLTLQAEPATCKLANVQTTVENELPTPDNNADYPYGLIEFEAACNEANITVFYHGSEELNGAYRKYGPTPPYTNGLSEWYSLPNVTLGFVKIGDKNLLKVSFTLKDGELGDDTKVDGKIIDIGGLTLEAVENYTASGTIRDKEGNPLSDVTIQIGDKTTTTDTTGYWEINGLAEGEYTVIASKAGYQFDSKPCVVSDNVKVCQPAIKGEPLLDVKVVPEPRIAKQGENVIYTITVTNQGEETASSVTLTDVLPDNTNLVSIESLDGGPCESETVTCSLPDLTPGATANVKVVISNRFPETLINTVTVNTQEYPTDVKKTWTQVIPYLSVSVTDLPDPIEMLKVLHYSVAVELSHYAPFDATDVTLVSQLPIGVELKALNSDYALCDSTFPKITCQFNDLSIASADSVSQATVEMEVELQDAGLLLLTHEAKVTANEYPAHLVRERTTIFIPDDIQVDLAFVIDVTGSMQAEMNGVIAGLTKFIDEIDTSTAPLMALLTFGDEVKVAAFTQDMDVLRGALADLTASGGGLCEEAAVEALLVAIPHTKVGGEILFATDASPYPDADVEKVIELLRAKGIRFNAMITGDCSMPESWNNLP